MPSAESPIVVAATHPVQDICRALHYIAPAATLLYYLITTTISVLTLQNLKGVDRKVPRQLLLLLMSSVLASYMLEALMLLIDTFTRGALHSSMDSNVYALSNVLVWMVLSGTLSENGRIGYPLYGSCLVCLVAEATLFALGLSQSGYFNTFVYFEVAFQACRILALVSLPTVLFITASTSTSNGKDEESAPLLGQDKVPDTTETSAANSTYGAISPACDGTEDSESDDEASYKKHDKKKIELQERLRAKGNWFTYARSFSIFVPFLWPSKKPVVQLQILGVILCLLSKRALNVLQPRQLGIVLDSLNTSKTDGSIKILVSEVLLYVFYRWVWSSVLEPIRRRLWLPVQQNALKALKTGAYNQIMGLSRDFHTEKHSGELYRSIDQGTSIINILDTALFHMLPVLVDLVVAIGYLYHVFGPYMALIIAATSVTYFWTSSYYLGRITIASRKCTKLSRKESQVMYDSVGGWHTVSYFNRVGYEQDRYAKVVGSHSDALQSYSSLYFFSDALEETAIDLGLAGAAFLAVYQIAYGDQPIGSFVMLMAYWGNFTGSLWYLVSTQRQFLHNLIDAEALLELFQKKPTVKDGSRSFQYHRGAINFHAVRFSYDGKKDTIKDLDFNTGPGQRVSLVGETGGGKSTILKLLFRFYDVTQGSVKIDDQDVKDVTLESLRKCIGVVPQDPSMFNDTIMENVRYSKPDATDEEVIEACKAAAVHEKICSFTKGYASKVGEGGVKLSGGEMQRIAIARVILKNPKIVLLDEATSAVDSETEAKIQGALEKLTKDRTTFTVAHRLSTVANSDLILVIKNGEIAEKGSPKALLQAKGKYHDLWLRQIGIVNAPEDEKATEPELNSEIRSEQKEDTRRLSGDSLASGSNSLKPTAPTFVPRTDPVPHYQRGTASEGGQASHDHGVSGHQNSHDSANAKTNAGNNKAAQEPKPIGNTDGASDAVDYLAGTSNTTEEVANRSAARKQPMNASQRRRRNKSEPSATTSKNNQGDVPSEGTSGTVSPMRQQPRRVSAPSNASSSVLRAVGTRQQRRQRQRHRHFKIKEREALAQGSGTTIGEGSGALSSRALHPSTPLAPPNTPMEGVSATNSFGVIGNGRSSVHFAPEA